MSTDSAEIWYAVVFDYAKYECGVKIWDGTFFGQKVMFFLGAEPPKSDRKLKLSDFDEIWYPGVFDGPDFKTRIHSYVESFFRVYRWFWGPLSFSQKIVEIES